MKINKDTLRIDPAEYSRKIEEFIYRAVESDYRRRGVVVGLSGGLDSSVTAALSVRALGAGKVFGLILPERDSNPLSKEYGRLVAESLGIEYSETDITPTLESLHVYTKRAEIVKRVFPHAKGNYKFRLLLPQNLLDEERLSVYFLEVLFEDGSVQRKRLTRNDYLELMAANDIKQRVRMTKLYYEAERRHYIVCGTTNRSELLQGFFVKYGDGGVDIEPLASLYKTQVYQLGRYLGIPEEILSRSPSPDTYSFEVSDEEFYFRLPFSVLDHTLYAIEHGIPMEEVAETLDLTTEQMSRAWKDIDHKHKITELLRQLPPYPDLG